MSEHQVLARIDATRFYDRTEGYREEIRAWLRANGVNPNAVTIRRDVEVVLLDAPAIVREEYLDGADKGRTYPDGELRARVVHSLLRVPLPEHLADPL